MLRYDVVQQQHQQQEMFKYILICSLLAHTIWAKPLHPHHSELTPHVLIVTPQAQLRLESLVPGTPIIQHLSPFTRYITPHEETIVYVPASAAAAIHNAEIVSRSLEGNKGKQFNPSDFANNAGALASGGLSALQNAGQAAAETASSYIGGSSSFVPSLGNPASSLQGAAESFFQGAQSAISGYVQGTQAQQQQQAQTQLLSAETPLIASEVALPPIISEQKLPLISAAVSLPPIVSSEQKLPVLSLAPKISSLSSLLQPVLPSISIYTNEPRHHYVVAPSAPHVVDFVPGSIFLSPATATTIKARRSILAEDKDAEAAQLALATPALYASNNDLEKQELLLKEKKEELLLKEKKEEFKRFLEANALKEEIKEGQQLDTKAMEDIRLPEEQKADEKIILEKSPLELNSPPEAGNKNENETPQLKEAS